MSGDDPRADEVLRRMELAGWAFAPAEDWGSERPWNRIILGDYTEAWLQPIGTWERIRHTRVGRWRISTVGDYRLRGEDFPPETMGAGPELYESMVFPVSGYGTHGEGDVTKWEEERTVRYMTAEEACVGHLELCREFAQRQEEES